VRHSKHKQTIQRARAEKLCTPGTKNELNVCSIKVKATHVPRNWLTVPCIYQLATQIFMNNYLLFH